MPAEHRPPALTGEPHRPRESATIVPGFLGGDRLGALPPFAALVVVSGLAFGGFNDASGQAVSFLLNAAMLAVLLLERPPGLDQWRRIAPVLALLGAALAWVGLVAAFGPVDAWLAPDLFAAEALSYVGGVAALLAGWMIGSRDGAARPTVAWLVALAAILMVAGLIMRQLGAVGLVDAWPVERDDRFQGFIGNANAAAAAAGAVAMLAAGRLRSLLEHGLPRDRRHRVFVAGYGVAALVLTLALLATASRFAVVATLLVAAALIRIRIRIGGLRLAPRRRVALGVVAAVAILVGIAAWSTVLSRRMEALPDNLSLRTAMWGHYLQVIGQAPLTGYGLGSFPTINKLFLTDPVLAEQSWTANSAHDVLLQLALVGGLPYLALLVAAALIGTRGMMKGMRGRWTPESTGVAGAVLVIVAVSMVDIVLDMPATVTLAAFLAGLIWGEAQRALSHEPDADPS